MAYRHLKLSPSIGSKHLGKYEKLEHPMSAIEKIQLTELYLNIYETYENLNSCMSKIIGNMVA